MARNKSTPMFADYGRIRDPETLGALARLHRKRMDLTLQDISDTSALGMRFLSEMERGKENVSLGKTLQALETLGLDVLVLPRDEATRLIRERNRRAHSHPERGNKK